MLKLRTLRIDPGYPARFAPPTVGRRIASRIPPRHVERRVAKGMTTIRKCQAFSVYLFSWRDFRQLCDRFWRRSFRKCSLRVFAMRFSIILCIGFRDAIFKNADYLFPRREFRTCSLLVFVALFSTILCNGFRDAIFAISVYLLSRRELRKCSLLVFVARCSTIL